MSDFMRMEAIDLLPGDMVHPADFLGDYNPQHDECGSMSAEDWARLTAEDWHVEEVVQVGQSKVRIKVSHFGTWTVPAEQEFTVTKTTPYLELLAERGAEELGIEVE